MDQKLTIYQAYKAMFVFLDANYAEREKPEELGLILSEMELLEQ